MPPSPARVCITGGAGFIGSHLVERLLDRHEIVVYDNLHRNALQFAAVQNHPHLRVIRGDVMDYESVRRAVDGCEIVIHCAAIAGVYSVDRNAVTTMEVNLLGTHHVVKAALDSGVKRFVEFSTSEVYGPFIHKGKEDGPTTIGPVGESRWVYAASKLASEHLSYAHFKEDGLPLVIIGPSTYGLRGRRRRDSRNHIRRRSAVTPITTAQIRAWCFVDDFVDGVDGRASRRWGRRSPGNPQVTVTTRACEHDHRLTGSRSDIVFPLSRPEVDHACRPSKPRRSSTFSRAYRSKRGLREPYRVPSISRR